MTRLARILHPTDFSECSRRAAQWACDLAELYDGELHVLFVLEDSMEKLPVDIESFPPPNQEESQMPPEDRAALAEQMGAGLPDDLRLRCATRQGFAGDAILRYAELNSMDLVVMGTHGRTGLRHAVLGSIAEHVVRRAKCPVLTVRGPS